MRPDLNSAPGGFHAFDIGGHKFPFPVVMIGRSGRPFLVKNLALLSNDPMTCIGRVQFAYNFAGKPQEQGGSMRLDVSLLEAPDPLALALSMQRAVKTMCLELDTHLAMTAFRSRYPKHLRRAWRAEGKGWKRGMRRPR